MEKSQWTVMLIPHDDERVRSIQLSGPGVKAVLSLVLLIVLLSGVFTAAHFLGQEQQQRAQQLRRENLLLAAEVSGIRNEMESLTASIEELAGKDEKYRAIAGLPTPVDEDGRSGVALAEKPLKALLEEGDPALGEQIDAASYDLDSLIQRTAVMRASMDRALARLEANSERLEFTPSISPASGHLSSPFSTSRRHPVLRISRPHQGIDIVARIGEPILAPAEGTVIYAGTRPGGYGRVVELDHGYGYVTRFAHASKILVKVGQTVERGEPIAEVGASGLVTGPHLHYEVELNGAAVDPLNFIIGEVLPE